MSDCVEAQRSFGEREGNDGCSDNIEQAANDDSRTNFEALSDYEQSAYYECLRLAAQMLEQATEEDLSNADVNLARLAA
jgi:hypothetical protein